MDQSTRTVLGLQAYRVISTRRREDGDEEVEVRLPVSSPCPGCGKPTDRVHQRSRRPSPILWGFLNERRLWLVVQRRPLRCGPCGRVFAQPLPGVAPRQRVSVAAQVAVLAALSQQSFAGLRHSHRISYQRAQRLLLRLPVPWCDWASLVGHEGPIALGVDEHSFRGTDLVITVTCLSTHRLVAILPNNRQATLRDFLRQLPQEVQERVTAVCTDLKPSYRSVIRRVLPQAVLVADHFHVIQDANRRLDETRRLEQAEAKVTLRRWPLVKAPDHLTPRQQRQLVEMLERFPTLREQYLLKEDLRRLYTYPDATSATPHWQRLLLNAEAADDAATVLWARTLRRWDQEILGYFQQRITNGFTEGCHTKVKLLKRLGYGFRNVQVYIRKMLLGSTPRSFEVLAPHLLT